MRDVLDFMPWVRPFAPSVPDAVAARQIVDAAAYFCRVTRCWREVQEVASDGTDFEVMCVPPGAQLFEIERADFDGIQLEPVALNDIPPHMIPQAVDGKQSPGSLCSPRFVSARGHDAVIVAPPAAGTLRISLFLTPSPDADMLPDVLFDNFAQAIGGGALARILVLPSQPFTNPEMAAMFANTFTYACDTNFDYNRRGPHRAATRTRASWF